eukprot:TRINITY_DN1019_c0_g1_i2.p1 TRINITY_DN1019_c0_g1~~TRINITY_DN1019_c0_g1_i2.p1  ORF type:complete len:101 (+),score=4.66 TRINITY_DN1019_c0_g1_i2:94-396(+)
MCVAKKPLFAPVSDICRQGASTAKRSECDVPSPLSFSPSPPTCSLSPDGFPPAPYTPVAGSRHHWQTDGCLSCNLQKRVQRWSPLLQPLTLNPILFAIAY